MEVDNYSMEKSIDMREACKLWQLNSIIETKLREEGILAFFEIQYKAIPQILDCDKCGISRDICICAPTGSGKTLVYVIPIIQRLIKRIIPRIRALVVVPTQDLAYQSKDVFDTYIQGTDLRVGILTGNGNEDASFRYMNAQYWIDTENELPAVLESDENVDIVIATPGKLVSYIKNNPSFDLHDLEYLIVDEADKLLLQSYNNWIHVLYDKLDETPISSLEHSPQGMILHPSSNHTLHDNGSISIIKGVRKILLSATLNSESNINLQKLRLNNLLLYTSKNVTADNVWIVPKGLHESYYECDMVKKPFEGNRMIIFCNSIDTVHRLYTLCTLFLSDSSFIAEYSSHLTSFQRSENMNAFLDGTVSVLICSDTIARGIDIPDITRVINYDAPSYPETYIHRAGRTARAMKEGSVVSLVRPEQEQFFLHMTSKITGSHVVKEAPLEIDPESEASYIQAVTQLKTVLMDEKKK